MHLQEQAAAAAAARAEEEERLAARPQRKVAPRPVRSRAASPSSDSEEFDSPVARYRGMPPATPEKKRIEKTMPFGVNLMRSQVLYQAAQVSATPHCGGVQRKVHWFGSCASDGLAHLSDHSALQPTLAVLCVSVSLCVHVCVTCKNKQNQML